MWKLAGWFPATPYKDAVRRHTPAERARLKALLAQVGKVLDPIEVTRDGRVIDGHTRLELARELGFDEVPVLIVDAASEAEEWALAVELNVARRHLTPE